MYYQLFLLFRGVYYKLYIFRNIAQHGHVKHRPSSRCCVPPRWLFAGLLQYLFWPTRVLFLLNFGRFGTTFARWRLCWHQSRVWVEQGCEWMFVGFEVTDAECDVRMNKIRKFWACFIFFSVYILSVHKCIWQCHFVLGIFYSLHFFSCTVCSLCIRVINFSLHVRTVLFLHMQNPPVHSNRTNIDWPSQPCSA